MPAKTALRQKSRDSKRRFHDGEKSLQFNSVFFSISRTKRLPVLKESGLKKCSLRVFEYVAQSRICFNKI